MGADGAMLEIAREALLARYPAMMRDAKGCARAAQFAAAVAKYESAYGADTDAAGKLRNTNNWGAITIKQLPDGSCPPNGRAAQDRRPGADGPVTYSACFQTFANPRQGADRFVEVLYRDRPAVLAAALMGRYRDAVAAMYRTKYFLGLTGSERADVDAYHRGLVARGRGIAAATGTPWLETVSPPASDLAFSVIIGAGLEVALVALVARRWAR